MSFFYPARRLSMACLGVLCIGAGSFALLARHDVIGRVVVTPPLPASVSSIRLTPVSLKLQNGSPDTIVTPRVKIDVNALDAQPAALDALRDAFSGSALLPGNVPTTLPDNPPTQGSETTPTMTPAWFTWGRLGEARIQTTLTLPDSLQNGGLGAYATRTADTATLCLANKTSGRILTDVQIRLPEGVYCIERLTYTLPVRSQENPSHVSSQSGSVRAIAFKDDANPSEVNPNAAGAPFPRLERLEGCDFGNISRVTKRFCMEPGQVCFYRFTDEARTARVAWRDVYAQLGQMAHTQPSPAHRLATMLHEADRYVSGVHGGSARRNSSTRLECVHHLLLNLAQAQSLQRNYQMRHTVEEESGANVMAAMERLTDALSETSAVLMGMVPQVELVSASNTNPNVRNVAAQGASGAENVPLVRTIMVVLANTGNRSVSNVKLSLNTADLPQGVTCNPADPAYFGSLHPGQTVRATFHVQGEALADLPANRLGAEVSYFAGTAPAHLRPRPW